jgi:hypothetical protein
VAYRFTPAASEKPSVRPRVASNSMNEYYEVLRP